MASYPPAVVGSLDQASIDAAIAAAGPGGKVLFPGGVYPNLDGLAHTQPHQTWEFDYGAVLLRSTTSLTSLVSLQAPGLKVRGGMFDGNIAGNPNVANLFDCGSNDLDIQDATLQNVMNRGILMSSALLTAKRNRFSNVRWEEINWSHTLLTAVQAPTIEDNFVDKSMRPAGESGSIYVRAVNPNNYQLALSPRINRNKIIQPWANDSAIVGILPGGCQRGFACENIIIGGGNGMSLDNNGYMEFCANVFQSCGVYSMEVGGNDNLLAHNKGSGLGPSRFGIFVNPVVTGSALIGNHFPVGFTDGGIVNAAGAGCRVSADNW